MLKNPFRDIKFRNEGTYETHWILIKRKMFVKRESENPIRSGAWRDMFFSCVYNFLMIRLKGRERDCVRSNKKGVFDYARRVCRQNAFCGPL